MLKQKAWQVVATVCCQNNPLPSLPHICFGFEQIDLIHSCHMKNIWKFVKLSHSLLRHQLCMNNWVKFWNMMLQFEGSLLQKQKQVKSAMISLRLNFKFCLFSFRANNYKISHKISVLDMWKKLKIFTFHANKHW